MCRRGEIYYVTFKAEAETNKQRGGRPVLVVSNNKANTHGPVVTIIPLTSKTWKKPHLPTHVIIPKTAGFGLDRSSMALAEQVETIDKSRLGDRKGKITDEGLMAEITKALQVQIGAFSEYNDF